MLPLRTLYLPESVVHTGINTKSTWKKSFASQGVNMHVPSHRATGRPTGLPTYLPTYQPTHQPTYIPTDSSVPHTRCGIVNLSFHQYSDSDRPTYFLFCFLATPINQFLIIFGRCTLYTPVCLQDEPTNT